MYSFIIIVKYYCIIDQTNAASEREILLHVFDLVLWLLNRQMHFLKLT